MTSIRLGGAPKAALVGTLAAAILGVLVSREGLLIAIAFPVAIALISFVQARPLNGLIVGVALVLVIPYWYSKGGITVMQLAAGMAILTIVMATVLQGAKLRWTPIDLAVIGLVLAAVLDWWLRGENFLAGRATANTVLPLAFYFAARFTIGRGNRTLLWTLIAMGSLAALSLFYEFATGSSVFIDPNSYYWTSTTGHAIFRPGGVFGSPPAAVTVLAMVALVAVALQREVSTRRRPLIRLGLALIVAGGVITFTRAGWIGFGIGLLVDFLILRWRGGLRLPRAVALLPIVAVAVVLALPALSQISWFQLGVERGGTFAARQSYWSLSLPLITDSPQHLLVGRGLNSLVEGMRTQLGGLDASIAAAPALIADGTHNQYLRTLIEQGLVGLALIVLWLGGALALALRYMARLTGNDRRLVAGIAASIVCFLVVSFVDTTMRDPISVAVLALLTGILVSVCRPTQSRVT